MAAATEPAFARLMKPLVDGGFVERDPERMIWTPVAIVGLFLLRGLTSFINDYSTTWLAGHLVMRLREEMFSKLLRLPVSYYDDNASGRVLSRIAYDVNQVHLGYPTPRCLYFLKLISLLDSKLELPRLS